jgi:serine/threonine protein kinase
MGKALSLARIEDQYHLQKVKLGEGSFGTVWRAVDKHDGSIAAVKHLERQKITRKGVQPHMLEREYKTMMQFDHPNIARCLHTYENEKNFYIALEFCSGGDLGDKVKVMKYAITEAQASDWMRQVLAAIAALHAKCICHRDIKPDNYLLSNAKTLKLTDFGLAIYLPFEKKLADKCGTPAMMSPEIHQLPHQSRGYNNLCDMWAAGLTLYMIIFGGVHPFIDEEKSWMDFDWFGNEPVKVDVKKLTKGELDFGMAQRVLGIGSWYQANTDQAQTLCRRLVEPVLSRRCSAEKALQDPWICRRAVPQGGDSQETIAYPRKPLALQQPEEQRFFSWRREAQRQDPWTSTLLGCLDPQVSYGFAEDNQQIGQSVYKDYTLPEVKVIDNRFSRQSRLAPGTKCSYYASSMSKWIPATIVQFNVADGTYNLDVKENAPRKEICPRGDIKAADAWPDGTRVYYASSTHDELIPAVIRSFNEGESGRLGTYNLCVRGFAQVDKIRPRF